MRKRLLSILLTLCMVFGMLPQMALATEIPSGYSDGGDVGETGLDLSQAPSQNTYYKAGDGYILWDGANTLTLKDATIDTTTGNAFALTLKRTDDVTIVAEGTNVLVSNTNGISYAMGGDGGDSANTVIKGSGTLAVTSEDTAPFGCSAISLNGALTISGDVTVTPINNKNSQNSLSTRGGISIMENASLGFTENTPTGEIKLDTSGDITVDTTGKVDASYMFINGKFIHTNGKLADLWVEEYESQNYYVSTVYNNYTLTEGQTIYDYPNEDGLTIPNGATLTINKDVTLTVQDDDDTGIPTITNLGTIVNNGTIQFPATATDAIILELTKNGTLTGSGKVIRDGKEVAPVNGGVYEVTGTPKTDSGMDLHEAPTTTTCYKAGNGYILWQPSDGKVTLQNASIETANPALFLPGNNITIEAVGENNLVSTGAKGIYKPYGDILVQGSGTLNIQGQNTGIDNGSGNFTLTEGVNVNLTGVIKGIYAGKIFIYGNGNANVTSNKIIAGEITIDTQGTVNVETMCLGKFNYTEGTITGSWITEDRGDQRSNNINTVYGNVVLNNDNIIWDPTGEKGLTIMNGATLTINDGVTLTVGDDESIAGVPKITNNGTIVNNGTIEFPAVTTGAEIKALGITGNGTIKIGDKEIIIVDDDIYPFGGDVSNGGVDLTVDTPTADTYYKAYNGYMIFSPSNGTLTMHNAEITAEQAKPIITLPASNIKLVLEGENALTNMSIDKHFAPAIQQGQPMVTGNNMSVITPQPYSLTVSGNGSLATITKSEDMSISTDGTFVVESGTLKSGNADDNCFGIETVDFKMTGGSLEASLGLKILGNALVEGGTIFTPGSNGSNGKINCRGNFEMTGGTVTCGATMDGGLIVYGDITKTGGTLNALVNTYEASGTTGTNFFIPYGSAPMEFYDNNGNARDTVVIFLGDIIQLFPCKLNIPSGNTLTIPKGAVLDVCEYMKGLSVSDYVTNNGSLVNDGTIVLPDDSTQEDVNASLAILKPTGTGMVQVFVGTANKYYTNSGEPINAVPALDLDTTETYGDGYTWAGNATDGFSLILDNLVVTNDNITLPSGVPVTMGLNGNTVVEGGITFSGVEASNLTICGTGTITMNEGISGGSSNGGSLTIQDQATVTVGGNISLADLMNHNGNVIVDGESASLLVTGESDNYVSGSIGVMADTVQVLNGAHMTVHSDGMGIFVNNGEVIVTGGSTLNVGCEYGVYIQNGKLTVDKTSKLITNGSIAPFYVVDTTNTKAESDMVSLPGIPRGTQIASVQCNSYKYWSLVPKGATLGVDETQVPFKLTGAFTGNATFAYKKKSSDDSVDGGGSVSTTNYTITAKAQKGGTISPDGEVSVSKNADKTFTITANKGYEVKDVIVDGASVGKVTKYSFEDVTKAHTITASFVETKEEVKEEVKEEKKDENSKKASFGDVKDGDWFKKAVDYVTENGLMSGTSDKEFAPNLSTTRGMIVTILWRLEGQPSAKGKANFTDVADGEYYAEAVAWAAENDIVGGYGNGIFAPNDVITREQLASILYRYSKVKGYDTTQGGMAVKEFSDYSQLSSWAGESTSWAVNAGLISGTGNSQLDPKGSATRAQVASILMRYCEEVEK
ncbi:MAG: S-layer homology domain-containing protein [Anaerotignaceae bacterium]